MWCGRLLQGRYEGWRAGTAAGTRVSSLFPFFPRSFYLLTFFIFLPQSSMNEGAAAGVELGA